MGVSELMPPWDFLPEAGRILVSSTCWVYKQFFVQVNASSGTSEKVDPASFFFQVLLFNVGISGRRLQEGRRLSGTKACTCLSRRAIGAKHRQSVPTIQNIIMEKRK